VRVFLVEYDRSERRLVRLEDFGDDRERANIARLAAELHAMADHLDREIVTLESESLEVLHRTHASYFGSPEELRAHFRPEPEAA
jgi:hypothetical protein